MNKHKVTVFVEGLAELIFVRQLLSVWFEYDSAKVGFDCLSLRKAQYEYAPYSFGAKDSECYYQIFNIGNDSKVVGEIRRLSSNLHAKGFSVLGLRDMYSEKYIDEAKKRGELAVHEDLIKHFIDTANQVIEAVLPEDVRKDVNLCFAIMEVEAWFLAMKDQNADNIEQILHPAREFQKNVMPEYGKHGTQIEGLVSEWTKDDYINLYNSGRCPSFNRFLELLIPREHQPVM